MGKGTPLFSTKFGSAQLRLGWNPFRPNNNVFGPGRIWTPSVCLLPLPSRQGLGLYWEAQKSFWVIPLILGIYCALILICVAPLCGFHMYLIGTAQTTRCVGDPVSVLGARGVRLWHAGETNPRPLPREAFKDEPASRSSYSRGLLRNFHDICCFHDNPFPRPPGPTPPDLPVEMQPRPQPALFV